MNEKSIPVPAPAETASAPEQAGSGRRMRAIIILLLIVLCGGWLIARWFIRSQTHIETDNAFVDAHVLAVSSRVPGTVTAVHVRDNQQVKKGDLLVEIDQRDYQMQVDQASAGVGVALNETGGEQRKVSGAQAVVQSATARFEQAGIDLQRGEKLFSRDVIPREQLDRLTTAQKVAEAQLREAEEALKRVRAEAGLSPKGGGTAKVQLRAAQLEDTRLKLSYTKIYAPQDGSITRKSVEAGAIIQAGQPLMALVPLSNVWVTANFKERQLTHIKAGQHVEFTVDAYPGRSFKGTVDSIMAGTGAAFSLLPPENATGNYVKVIQRIPVKIGITGVPDPRYPLRVGMSVIPTVNTGRSAADVIKGLNPF
ncbi:MAG TPA: HlyD family secretion protein [Desulfuromonadales bacterium]|nr:HlyD family secretion protein [Desulfuromonadales bacterium]